MIQTNLHTISPTLQALPLALRTESLTIRATLVTPILREIPGYCHGGIND